MITRWVTKELFVEITVGKLTIIAESKLEGVDKVCEWYEAVERIIDENDPDTAYIHQDL